MLGSPPLEEQTGIRVFVKLEFWDAYRAAVVLTTRQFRTILIIFGIIGTLMFAVFVLSVFHPRPGRDWYEISRNAKPLLSAFGILVLFVFILPLITAKKVVSDERVRSGVRYRFSSAGIHVESSVATADLLWAAFRQAIETRSAFLLLPNATVAHILPQRFFESVSDVAAMRELLRANVRKTKLRS